MMGVIYLNKKKVFVVHNNMDYINKVNQFFLKGDGYTLVDYALDGQTFVKKCNLNNCDIVIVKNALTHITGLYALELLLEKDNIKDRPKHIILLTPFINKLIIDKCSQLGINHVKTFELQINKFPELVMELDLIEENKNKLYFDKQMEILKLLRDIGLLRTYIGYTYFEYILNIMLDQSEYIYKPMHFLYKLIANHFKVTNTSVEKAMRSCIRSSLLRNDSYYAKMLFGYSYEKKEFPSTSIVLQVCIKTLKEQKNIIINNNMQNSLRKI